MKPFVIYQITDLHLPDDENHEIGLRFKKLMEFISSHPPDLLAITGDLTMTDGSKQICQRIKDSIPRQMEYAVIPGNHDDAVVLNEVFDNRYDSLGEFCYSIPLDSIDLLFVDSSSHILPENHIDFINNQDLRSSSILFIHHPPILLSHGKGFMDSNYPLKNHQLVNQSILDSKIEYVFCGHYHNVFCVSLESYTLHLTPSIASKIKLNSESFELEEVELLLRIIQVSGSQVRTYLKNII